MKKFSLYAAAFVVASFLGGCDSNMNDEVMPNANHQIEQLSNGRVENTDGKYIVILKEGTVSEELLNQESNFKNRGQAMRSQVAQFNASRNINANAEEVYSKAVKGFSIKLTGKQVKQLQEDPAVLLVEKDKVISLAKPTKGGGGTSPAQETPWGITRVGGASNYAGSNVAWVLDTGIDVDHEDLNVDASRGFSAFTKGRDAGVDDGNGHGTHVAGTIAAIDNAVGVVGVAAGATVIPVKVLGSRGSGSTSGVIAGIDFVAANATVGDVANMSLGGGISTGIDQAVQNAAAQGIIFALAAGNESQDANNSSPGRTNGDNIYTISASDINDNFASFSNYGSDVDFCAPGVSIKSTWFGGGYNTISGTSMATPHAAGILLVTGGNPTTSGYVNGDPDGNPDPIMHQ